MSPTCHGPELRAIIIGLTVLPQLNGLPIVAHGKDDEEMPDHMATSQIESAGEDALWEVRRVEEEAADVGEDDRAHRSCDSKSVS